MLRLLTAWLSRRQALRELRALDYRDDNDSKMYADGSRGFFEDQIDRARNALDGGDREVALAIWDQTRRLFPKIAGTSKLAINLLLDLGSFDELLGIIEEGQKRYPGHAQYAVGLAAVAQRRGDPQKALRLSEIVQKKFPDTIEGYTIAAACLGKLGRPQEAESTITQAAHKFPNNFETLVEYARCAMSRHDWQQALQRWEATKRQFDQTMVSINIAECLRRLGRHVEAEEVAVDLSKRFPGNPWVFVELAHIATAKGDLQSAVRHWGIARNRNPFFASSYIEGAEAARKIGRSADADAILNDGIVRLRLDLDVHLEYARSAERSGNFTAAVERWALVKQRFPGCAEASQKIGELAALNANPLPSPP